MGDNIHTSGSFVLVEMSFYFNTAAAYFQAVRHRAARRSCAMQRVQLYNFNDFVFSRIEAQRASPCAVLYC